MGIFSRSFAKEKRMNSTQKLGLALAAGAAGLLAYKQPWQKPQVGGDDKTFTSKNDGEKAIEKLGTGIEDIQKDGKKDTDELGSDIQEIKKGGEKVNDKLGSGIEDIQKDGKKAMKELQYI